MKKRPKMTGHLDQEIQRLKTKLIERNEDNAGP